MGHRYGIKILDSSEHEIHQALISLPSYYARSSELGYLTDGFEVRNANAYIFIRAENRIGSAPHPDTEVVIEPYGVYINSFTYLEEIEDSLSTHFKILGHIL
jgi:hypothetical protein